MEMERAGPGTSNHIARTDDLLTHAVGLEKLSAESKRRGKGCLGRTETVDSAGISCGHSLPDQLLRTAWEFERNAELCPAPMNPNLPFSTLR